MVQFFNNFFLFNPTLKNVWKALVFLMASLAITFGAALFTAREETVKEKNEFALMSAEIRTKISVRLHAHAQLLQTGSAFFAASDTVTRKEWKIFNNRAKIQLHLPGIEGLGYAIIVPKRNLERHVEQIRGEGFPGFAVKPSGDRPVYTAIIYLEPFSGRNLRAFGYDMFTEPTRRKAMEQARDSDVAMLSGKVTLVQETNKNRQTGTLMYVPVYRHNMPVTTVDQRRKAIVGWVYSPYRMNDLMQGILGQYDVGKNERIHLQIYDDSISANTLLFNNQTNTILAGDDAPTRTVSLPIVFNGKKWILHCTQSHEQSAVGSKVLFIFTIGFAMSLLVFALSLALFNTYSRAQQIARKLMLDLKDSDERFKILLNSAAEGIYGLDLNGNCTFSNTASYQILGYESSEQLVGKNMHVLIHHSQADGRSMDEENCLIHRSFQHGHRVHVDDEVFWRADGTCFPAEYWSNPILIEGKIEGSVITFFDITERKLSENRLMEARFEAERANKAKSNFLSRISHELRTPMNSILGFAQLMDMSELNPMLQKGVKHILKSGKHLLELINDVLDISSVESGKISFIWESVDLKEVISDVVEIVHPEAFMRHLTFEIEASDTADVPIMADRRRLKQVLLNFVNNAVKYNREGGVVTIKTEMIQTDPPGISSVRISVSDSGIGITPENLGQLFQPFERIGAEMTSIEGTGLGLTVVKSLVESMGGSVGAESVYEVGSTFWMELPQVEEIITEQ